LYALADRRDEHRAGCTGWWFRGNDEVLLVPPTVAAGTCSLIDRYPGPALQAAFQDSANTGDNNTSELAGLADSGLRPMAELVRRRADWA
jgi:hypothetical protein